MKTVTPACVLFDLDGTLLDTAPDLAVASNAMLADLGRGQLPEARIATFVGKGAEMLIQRCLRATGGGADDPGQLARARASWHAHYERVNGQYARLFPGVIEGLSGNRFAIYTKIHHSLVDGFTGMRILQRGLATTPDDLEHPFFFSTRKPSRPEGARRQAAAKPVLRSNVSALKVMVPLVSPPATSTRPSGSIVAEAELCAMICAFASPHVLAAGL